jgi:hypothetical protein
MILSSLQKFSEVKILIHFFVVEGERGDDTKKMCKILIFIFIGFLIDKDMY